MTASLTRATVICAIAGALLGLAAALTVFREFENTLGDFLTSQHAVSGPPRRNIVIVAIDDQSTAGIEYQSPISRRLLASVVRRLDSLGASVIALDVLLDRPSFPAEDEDLAVALGTARAKIVLGRYAEADAAASCASSARARSPAGEVLPAFAAHAVIADLTLCHDGDDVVRNMPSGRPGRPLLAEAVAAGMGASARADGRALPLTLTAAAALTIPVYSAALRGFMTEDRIKGAAVFIGAVTPSMGDWFATPLRFAEPDLGIEPRGLLPARRLPGVAVHAFQAAALIDNARGPQRSGIAALLLALVGGAAGSALGSARAGWLTRGAAAVGLTLAVGCAVLAAGAYLGALFPFSPFGAALALGAGLAAAAQETQQRRQKAQIRHAFENYLAPAVVERLIDDPALVASGASEREISVMFSDLAGFSTFVDATDPEIVRQVINGYLETIVSVVAEHGGMVDKIVGDAVHALFSAPIEDPDHRVKAVRCALAADAACETYRAEVKGRFDVSIGATRIGVHSGIATVGNFGGGGRLDYTAHGSTMNAGARLEAANKVFGTRVCVSAAASAAAPDVRYREIAEVRLRGIDTPMKVYEARRTGDIAEAELSLYAEALANPQHGRQVLEQLARQRPDDALLRFQLKRVAERTDGPLAV